jgi:hypothetical protein
LVSIALDVKCRVNKMPFIKYVNINLVCVW